MHPHPPAVLVALPVPEEGQDDAGTALVLTIPEDGSLPRVVWWGPVTDVEGATAEEVVAARRGGSGALGLAVLPEHSTGSYARPALRGHRPDPAGADPAWSTAFRLDDVTVEAATQDPRRAVQVRVEASDPVAGLTLRTELEALPGGLLRARHALTATAGGYALEGLEVVLPVPDDAGEVLDHTGGWLHERVVQRAPVRDGLWLREGRHGKTGHDAAGDVVVGPPGFGYGTGEVRGVSVGWSGNTVVRLERSPSTPTTLGGGELLLPGEVVLAAGESYSTPWLYLSASHHGLDGLTASTHAFVRAVGAHGGTAPARPVPVTLNVWEAVWFDHDLPHLLELVRLAAEVGAERFVLDDGWFGARRDDTAGLGDWTVSPDAWPQGLGLLADAVHGAGMQFGLWFEPEMVNPDSELYRAYPNWVLGARGTAPLLERDQLVLDLSRDEVREHVRDAVSAVLGSVAVDYVKWDHNRDLLEPGGAAAGGRPVVSAHTRAFYRLLDELRALHPRVEWESCASGGGRVDLEVLQHVQRVWTSDMTDAVARQDIQRAMVQQVPPEYLGAHVSAPVSHQTHRSIPLDFRAATAFFGAFGIEWDLSTATPQERDRLRRWVQLHQQHRTLLHSGRTWRAESSDPAVHSHGVVSHDGTQALLAQVQMAESVVEHPAPVKVPGLQPDRHYRLTWVGPEGTDGSAAPQPDLGARANGPLGWGRGATVDPLGPVGSVVLPGRALATVGVVLPRCHPLTITLVHLSAV